MEFNIKTLTLKELVSLYFENKLNLTPPYQRNAVWTKTAQLDLIDSIKNNYPLPTFFLRQLENSSYEMVDGQQRTRSILRYIKTDELSISDQEDQEFKDGMLNNYEIPITIITKLDDKERIEDFYHRVNSTGLHLNRPEKIKSKYLNSNYLQLSEFILNSEQFRNLDIFSDASHKRMLDRDFVEEIIALIHISISDKKKAVDRIYEKDLTVEEVEKVKTQLFNILKVINSFNDIYPIGKTRYKQRNDLYTLVSFLKKHKTFSTKQLIHFYHILVAIDPEIRPSDNTCPVFKDYALTCVSQSNSKDAREERLKILEDILFSAEVAKTEAQSEIIKFYKISDAMITLENVITFDYERLDLSIKTYRSVDDNNDTV